MTSRGSLAYAHARIRAAKSRLLTRSDALPLFLATDAAAMQRAVSALDVEHPLQRLVRVYETALLGYPHAAPLIHALLALHEIENVKLLWRGVVSHARISPLWLDLGTLATIAIVEAASSHDLAERLSSTPYGAITRSVARAHAGDPAAAELAFDRWASQRLLEEARRLPRRESLARRLLESVVRERDAELVRRGAKWYGLTSVSGNVEDVLTLRRERLRLCRRAFVGSPFLLATMIAVLLLAEEEVRAVRALVERQGDESLDVPLLRAIGGSQIGT
jgi:vacuolar-type H+-ATPase subunit C/Vma6